MGNYVFLILWTAFFYVSHSLLADKKMKDYFPKYFPYRIFYNLISILLFYRAYRVYTSIDDSLWYSVNLPIQIIAYALIVFGATIGFFSFMKYDFLEFTGFRFKAKQTKLHTGGLNTYSRHPMYLGLVIIIIGTLLLNPSIKFLLVSLLTFVYLYIGIRLEETKLTDEFGNEYEEYQQKVPMLFPKFIKKK